MNKMNEVKSPYCVDVINFKGLKSKFIVFFLFIFLQELHDSTLGKMVLIIKNTFMNTLIYLTSKDQRIQLILLLSRVETFAIFTSFFFAKVLLKFLRQLKIFK